MVAPEDVRDRLPDGLPGAALDPGTGPVVDALVETLFDDAAALAPDGTDGTDRPGSTVRAALARHREHRASWYEQAVGPLLVPVGTLEHLQAALQPGDHALRVVLVADPADPDPLTGLRRDCSLLLDDDRAELVGVQLTLPGGDPGDAARLVLDALAFTVPASVDLPLRPGWREAVDVLAADGVELAALRPTGWPDGDLAAVLRYAVDRDLAFTLPAGVDPLFRSGGDDGTGGTRHGLLNLLCGVRAALNGADPDEMTAVLAEQRVGPLASALRRMSQADAAVARAFVRSAGCRDLGARIDELAGLGLLARPRPR